MENKNFEYKGWKINGFVAIFLLLAMMAGSIAMIVLNIIGFENDTMQTGWLMIGGIVLLILSLCCIGGFILLEPNEARVLTFFGKYCGSFYDTGFV